MKFYPIFTKPNNCDLWSVCYPEDELDGESRDIYSILMDEKWTDVKYLYDCINLNKELFGDSYWEGKSIVEIIDSIQAEIACFDQELYNADMLNTSKDQRTLDKIFIKLHENIYSIRTSNESHRKARPNVDKSIIRLYGIELADKTIIITGGTLKFRKKMIGTNFEVEFKNLNRVQSFLRREGIIDKQGLIE